MFAKKTRNILDLTKTISIVLLFTSTCTIKMQKMINEMFAVLDVAGRLQAKI